MLVVFFFCYVGFPEKIAVNFDEGGLPIGFINKQQFFYWTIGVISGVNFLFLLFKNSIQKVNFKNVFTGSFQPDSDGIKSFFKGWTSALLAFINTYLVFVLLGLKKINATVEQTLDFNYNYLLWVGILIFLIILLFIPLKILALGSKK